MGFRVFQMIDRDDWPVTLTRMRRRGSRNTTTRKNRGSKETPIRVHCETRDAFEMSVTPVQLKVYRPLDRPFDPPSKYPSYHNCDYEPVCY